MTVDDLRRSLADPTPPPGIGHALQALWWDAKGDWEKAHECAQAMDDADGSWVHAYLHRKEGDQSNAGYWYRRAGKPHSGATLDEEWAEIAAALIIWQT
jgi:hypothetical protein